MSELNREIGGLIRNYRKAKNLTQDELSEKICKSKSTISKYEKGEHVTEGHLIVDELVKENFLYNFASSIFII